VISDSTINRRRDGNRVLLAKIQSIAALVTNFLVRAQCLRRQGIKSEARDVNEVPRPVNMAFERVFRSDDSVVETSTASVCQQVFLCASAIIATTCELDDSLLHCMPCLSKRELPPACNSSSAFRPGRERYCWKKTMTIALT